MNINAPKDNGSYDRTFRFSREAVNPENRTVELAYSSEEPFLRDFGVEILGHDKLEMDLGRFESGGHPLLLNHNRDQHIGVIEKAWLDEKDKRGRAVVRFAKEHNALADMVWKDVVDGIRSLVSVGYEVNQWERMCDDEDEDKKDGKKEAGEDKKKPPKWRAKRWTPMEISLVAIPADYKQSGVGREADGKEPDPPKPPEPEPPQEPMPVSEKQVTIMTRNKSMTEAEISAAEKERQELAAKQAREKAAKEAQQECEREQLIRKQEDSRVKEIYALTEKFKPSLREKALSEGWTVDQVRAAILEDMNPGMVARHQEPSAEQNAMRTIGELFINSPQYREVNHRGAKDRFRFAVEIPRLEFTRQPMVRAGASPLYAGGGAGAGQLSNFYTMTQALPGVPGLLDQQQLRIAQVFPQGTTTARRISYILEDTYTQGATGVNESAAKPEGVLDISETYADVEKIAVFTKVTEEMLMDVEQIRSYIEGRLAYMVQSKEDTQLVNGNGTAPNIRGLANVSGIQTLAAGAYPTVADAFGQAINKVRSVGFVEPDAILVHPNDWTDLTLSKDSNGQYYAGGPFSGAYGVGGFSNVGRMFGLPVVQTTFVTEGTAYVGAFRVGAQIFRREGLRIEATNSNEDDFEKNLISIRAEARMTPVWFKPLAFCQITAIA